MGRNRGCRGQAKAEPDPSPRSDSAPTSIPALWQTDPEKLIRALLLQVFYSIRSERLLEQLDYNLLFRWFVGLNTDGPVWVPTVFTHNRDRLGEDFNPPDTPS